MSISKKDFINYYAKQARNEVTSLFLGAGVSVSTGYPSWKTLLEPCAQELNIHLNDNIDLYLLAQYYANEYGNNALKRIINDNINNFNHESDLVESLLNLEFKTIWTTNYDTVIEQNLNKRKILMNKIFDNKDLANINTLNRVNIYKLNGDISNLDRIVITKDDVEKYEKNHELMLTFLKKELVSNTFLFLGYSFTDEIVLSCLSSVNKCLGDSANYHFAIMKDEKNETFNYFIKDLENRYHIRILLIDDFDELPNILNELKNEINKKNIFFSGVFERLPVEEDLFAEKICKLLTNELLSNGYRLYTGYGRNFGNYLCGSSIQYLLSHNMNIEKSLIMRPFLITMDEEDKKIHREMMINNCNITIFMFGQSPTKSGEYKNSSGVLKEFEIAKNNGKYIIPVGSTKYTSYEIWNYVKNNITLFPYLEKYVNGLISDSPTIVVKTIMQIINDIID